MGEYKFRYKKDQWGQVALLSDSFSGIEEIGEHAKSQREGMIYSAFSCESQHVYGATKEECLDKIYHAIKDKEKRINRYKNLPTLEEVVNCKKRIIKSKTYWTKKKDSTNDGCEGYSGDIILEMREIGIDEYFGRQMDAWLSTFPKGFVDKMRNNILSALKK